MLFRLPRVGFVSDAETQHLAFAATLESTIDMVWRLLTRGVADRHAPERHPTLATLGLDGAPKLRTLVLRSVDRGVATLECHTDLKSTKVEELQAEPRCSVHIWNPKQKLQMRLDAQADIIKGEAVDDVWVRVPEGSRRIYGGAPLPGSEISAPEAFEPDIDRDRFAVIRLNIQSVETLCLAPERHYRAQFLRVHDWSGQWLAP